MIRSALLAAMLIAAPTSAHEFWIEGSDHTIAPGGTISGHTLVGSELSGTRQPYRDDRFRRFEIWQDGAANAVTGRLGDLPALSVSAGGDGLVSIIHHSTDARLVYRDETLLERYLATEGLDHLMARHLERGLPLTGFSEVYSRQAKALYAAGSGAGSDVFTNMPFEMIALDNPYTTSGPIRVQLLLNGQPHADAPVNMFHRENGQGIQTRLRTNADGIFTAPDHGTDFTLLNAVHLFEVEPRRLNDPVWESYWASLTWRRDP